MPAEIKPKKGKKLSEREHVLNRPDMYIGSCISEDKEVWILEEYTEEESDTESDMVSVDENKPKKVEKRIIKKLFEDYNNGFSRIHIEDFSNIIDNKWESELMKVKMTTVKINFSEDYFRTENDGRWIPVELQEFEEIDPVTKKTVIREAYPVEIFFTELRSGTNYDDDEDRKTSGRNGIGIKTLVFFSKKTIVTCFDPQNKKKIVLTTTDNGKTVVLGKPEKYSGKSGKTVIECYPDFKRFGLEKYTTNWIAYFKKHAYDMAMITGLKVYFNDELIPVKNIKQYAQTVIGKSSNMIEINAQDCDVVLAERDPSFRDNKISHISFVNGIFTKNGGTHVNSWKDKLLGQIRDALNKTIKAPKDLDEKKIPKYSIDYFSQYFILFVRCEVDKPVFDSQTKDELHKPKISLTGKDGKFSEQELSKIMKWNFVSSAQDRWNFELDKVFDKVGKEHDKHYNPKVRLANWANSAKKKNTYFYITEGDSAKQLIEAGCSYIENGFNMYGVFPIRGKLPNAMKKSLNAMTANKEAQAIKSALNLRKNVDYQESTNISTLSHNGLRIATDSDADGSHIAALILAFFYAQYISLFKAGYISIQIFPKASKIIRGKKHFYYRDEDYKDLKDVKYYKGLGTFRNEDAEEFFNNQKIIVLIPTEEDEKWMNLALGDGETDKRKSWIAKYIDRKLNEEIESSLIEGDLEIPKFIKENLSVFFDEAFYRAIPSFVDGCKEGQRKNLFTLTEENIYMDDKCILDSVKLPALQGKILAKSEYHHGDDALGGSLVTQAQGYPGSNNIPYLFNDGQFGSRHGDKHAAFRYIGSKLDPIVRYIINKKDLPICEYKKGESKMIEPHYYPMLIPMLLVNGAYGIGVGYSCNIPCFNPLDIVQKIKNFLTEEEEDDEELMPWYRGYSGKIEKNGKKWKSTGTLKKVKDGLYEITELPISGKYAKTHTYKDFLWNWKKGKKNIKKINEDHTVNTVRFEILTDNSTVLKEEDLKLSANIQFNMWLVNHDGRPVFYDSIDKYLKDWCNHRLSIYKIRKKYWLNRLKFEKEVAEEKVRFINQVLDDEIILKRKKKEVVIQELIDNGYKKCNFQLCEWLSEEEDENEELEFQGEGKEGDEEEKKQKTPKWTLEYITKIGIMQQTEEEVERLKKEAEKKKEEYLALKKKKIEQIWMEELEAFEEYYPTFLEIRNKSDGKKQPKKSKGKKKN